VCVYLVLPLRHPMQLCWAYPVGLSNGAGTVIALMAFARHKGVNLSVLGIGVDFLQVWRAHLSHCCTLAVRANKLEMGTSNLLAQRPA
jgi:hypothetical protein